VSRTAYSQGEQIAPSLQPSRRLWPQWAIATAAGPIIGLFLIWITSPSLTDRSPASMAFLEGLNGLQLFVAAALAWTVGGILQWSALSPFAAQVRWWDFVVVNLVTQCLIWLLVFVILWSYLSLFFFTLGFVGVLAFITSPTLYLVIGAAVGLLLGVGTSQVLGRYLEKPGAWLRANIFAGILGQFAAVPLTPLLMGMYRELSTNDEFFVVSYVLVFGVLLTLITNGLITGYVLVSSWKLNKLPESTGAGTSIGDLVSQPDMDPASSTPSRTQRGCSKYVVLTIWLIMLFFSDCAFLGGAGIMSSVGTTQFSPLYFPGAFLAVHTCLLIAIVVGLLRGWSLGRFAQALVAAGVVWFVVSMLAFVTSKARPDFVWETSTVRVSMT
jgi:hypothetical protein